MVAVVPQKTDDVRFSRKGVVTILFQSHEIVSGNVSLAGNLINVQTPLFPGLSEILADGFHAQPSGAKRKLWIMFAVGGLS